MELAHIFSTLGRHRAWLVPVALVAIVAGLLTGYKPQLSSPFLKSKSYSRGAAATEAVIDSRASALTDTSRDLGPYTVRASVYANLMTSPSVLQAIGRAAGIPGGAIAAAGPIPNQPSNQQQATREQRGNQIAAEHDVARLQFDTAQDLPIITISAQAGTADTAARLANAAVKGFSNYLSRIQAVQRVPSRRRVEIRQLGPAAGGTINSGTAKAVMLLTFLGVFLAGCLMILLVSNVRESERRRRLVVHDGAAPTHGAAATGSDVRYSERERIVDFR
jgi:hypothetical protein